MPTKRPPPQTRECPVHAFQRHGREAHELRSAIEKLRDECISNPTGDPTTDSVLSDVVFGKLSEILQEVDARDSLAYAERNTTRKRRRAS